MSNGFELDPRIAADSLPLAEMDLCVVRLMNDSRYPWVLLVPRRPGIVEMFDLASSDRHALFDLAAHVAGAMVSRFFAGKINVGALGNRVRQFHLHVIARRTSDAAWPDAVWNGTAPAPYQAAALEKTLARARHCLPPELVT